MTDPHLIYFGIGFCIGVLLAILFYAWLKRE